MSASGQQRVVLVTGGNRGIGREIVRQLGRRYFHVVVGARLERSGQQTADEVNAQGGRASVLPLDVSDSATIRSAAAAFARLGDRLDVLINNAGIYADKGVDVLTLPRELLSRTFQTNTFGPIEVTQAFLPYLRRSDEARVINVSSGYGQIEGLSAGVPSYCLSKLALDGATIMLAEALRSKNVAVNAMCPGWVRTEMGGPTAPRSVEQGADTAVWLADEAPHELTGGFFRDRQPIPW
jgi:NAD(P)-dependent dehydrogenase (short-subunit alcohol dehydrogenase family)